VACWGRTIEGQSTPPAGTFTAVSAGGDHTCGVKTSGTVVCWGDDSSGEATPPAGFG
jgi:alpha-tubulin suppressor-like RCC1 family protein